MHIIPYATTAQSPFQMVVKSNTVSLRHNHSPETLIIHIPSVYAINFAFKILFSTKFYFQKFYFSKILSNFILFYFILIKFQNNFFFKVYFTMNSVHLMTQEKYRVKNQVENQAKCTSTKTGPACAHRSCARGRVVGGLVMSWPSPPAVSQRKAAMSQRSQRAPARPHILSSRLLPRARALQRPARLCPCHPAPMPHAHQCARRPARPSTPSPARPCARACRIVALAAVSWALAARQPGRFAGTVPCTPSQPSHITLCVLRYKIPAASLPHLATQPCLAIQFLPLLGSSLQYKFLYCNTIFIL